MKDLRVTYLIIHISQYLDKNESTGKFVQFARFNAEEEIFAIRRIECLQLLKPDKRWNVLSSNVCGERAPKYFSRNRLPARFPDDVVRVKRSFVQIFDGARSKGRLLGLIAIFFRHSPDSQLFQEENFESRRFPK